MSDMQTEIKELNLSYLMLAQRMIWEDKEAGAYRLGISAHLAEILADLAPAQVLKLAAANVMLCRARFDDRLILGLLTSHARGNALAHSHTAILMSGQPVEAIA